MIYKGKKITVMGLGRYPKGSGVSAVHFLCTQGARVTVTDLRTKEELKEQLKQLQKYTNIRYVLGKHEIRDFSHADMIVKNPAVPSQSPYLKEARKHKIPIHSDITLFLQEVDNPIIGITGTRGKSTTATLTHALLATRYPKVKLGGNITISPLQYLGKLGKHDPVVLELSSWMLNSLPTIKRSPDMALVTNVMIDHLNMYPSYGAYVRDKALIVKYQKKHDIAIFNKDNAETKKMATLAQGRVYWYSMKPLSAREAGVYVNARGEIIFQEGSEKMIIARVKDCALQAPHMISNTLGAIVIAILSGVTPNKIKKVLKIFKGVPSRLDTIRVHKGIRYVNDTTATTPDATIAALRSFREPIVLIAGGTDKKLEYTKLAQEVSASAIKELILLPGTATDILLPLLDLEKVNVSLVGNMKDAVMYATAHAEKGDVVLLSPGAASFGIFINEFDRGARFIRAVKELK